MYKIIDKKRLNSQITFIRLEAPHVAANVQAGQFIVLKINEKGERIPLTIVERDIKEGTISLIFQEVGRTTMELATMGPGESIMDIIGPLGKPTHIEKIGKIICVGGGVGTAEIYPVAKAYKEAGNEIISIIGARSKELLLFTDEMKALSSEIYLTTDDGSAGRKGLVTDVLKELLNKEKYDLVYAVGPIMMMRAVADTTRSHGLHTVVSLNANMVDATGMCGTCRVKVGDKTKFACVDGPEFDAHKIDFVEFINRDRRFKDKEKESLKFYEEAECKCKS